MPSPTDPYRTLGLTRGASIAEVRRAYRALAKIHHPDAAGPAALPRFLAIQAAYEQVLRSAPVRGARDRTAPKSEAPPSAADQERADATHRAYGGRSRRTRTNPSSEGAPGSPAAGRASGSGSAGRRAGTGRAGARPGRDGETDPGSGTSAAPEDRDGPGKATLGSTSYDGAEGQPFEPDWGGASWYGTTSGTYWTINPKEYADPRKHGPEYQARARRAARDRARTGAIGPEDGTTDADPAELGETPGGDPGADQQRPPAWKWTSRDAIDSTPGPSPGDPRPPRPRPRAPAADPPPPDLAAAATDLGRALIDERTGRGRWRLVQAVVGWLPILFGLGWLIGEMTGCGRFSASCDGLEGVLAPVIGLGVLGILVVAPVLASVAASAALSSLVVAVPTALVLSAGGAATDPVFQARTLGLALIVAWLAGFGFALLRRLRPVS